MIWAGRRSGLFKGLLNWAHLLVCMVAIFILEGIMMTTVLRSCNKKKRNLAKKNDNANMNDSNAVRRCSLSTASFDHAVVDVKYQVDGRTVVLASM